MIADLEKRNASLALWRKWYDAAQAAEDARGSGVNVDALVKAEDDAWSAYAGFAGGALIQTELGDDIERCAITSVPLLVSDDVVMVLRSALEAKLPCDVHLPPATTINKGCAVTTLLAGLRVREEAA